MESTRTLEEEIASRKAIAAEVEAHGSTLEGAIRMRLAEYVAEEYMEEVANAIIDDVYFFQRHYTSST